MTEPLPDVEGLVERVYANSHMLKLVYDPIFDSQTYRDIILFNEAAAEITRLNAALKYEENRSGRIGTHGPGCWAWGPRHYECLSTRLAELEAENARMREGLTDAARFIDDLASADLDEIAADGGVTVGMVFQQQARTVFGPRLRQIDGGKQ